MKKTFISVFTIFIGLALVSSTAFPWGSATHAYIDDQIGKRLGPKNKNEIYGGMAPDIFNYAFDLPQPLYDYLRAETHGVYGNTTDNKYFMKVWNEAGWGFQENLAYGFVSHNDMWGADSTAHWSAQATSPSPGFPVGALPSGYIIYKAFELEIMIGEGVWTELGLAGDALYELRIELCHNIVEAAGDIVLKEYGDSRIGKKISTSALLRGPSFRLLLIKAYAQDLCDNTGMSYSEAVELIRTAEKEFRRMMILQGQVLMQDTATAVDLIAGQFAELAIGYLASKGIPIPPEFTPEFLKPYVVEALWGAMSILGDYMEEVNATIDFVEQQLVLHGVSY